MQVIDPDNFHPLYTPDNLLHSHIVAMHIQKRGFLRVVER